MIRTRYAQPQLPRSVGNYQILSPIGSGGFATVYKARHIRTEVNAALKVVPKQGMLSQNPATLEREVNIHKTLEHPYIAEFYEKLEDDNNWYITMEFVENGTLLDYINNHDHNDRQFARKIFLQIVMSLDYLHNKVKVAHRDLKPENILLDRNLNIKMIDFGLSNNFSDDNPYLATQCGSGAYISPEVILHQPYTKATDIWSAGILLYAMVTGSLPFSDNNMQQLFKLIVRTQPYMPSSIEPELADLLNRLLAKEPESRITLDEIKNHEWVLGTREYNIILCMPRLLETTGLLTQYGELDDFIVQQMEERGIDVSNLLDLVQNNDYTDERVICYKMLKRQCAYSSLMLAAKKFSKTSITLFQPSSENTKVNEMLGNYEVVQLTKCVRRPTIQPIRINKPQSAKRPNILRNMMRATINLEAIA